MKKSTLIILIVLCVIAGIAGWIVRQEAQHRIGGTQAALDQELLPELPIAKIDRISIRTINDVVDLEKEDGIWLVQSAHDFPADQEKVRRLLMELRELRAVQRIPVAEGDLGRLELNEPQDGQGSTGTQIMLVDGARDLATIRLGKQHVQESTAPASPFGGAYPSGRYILLPDRSAEGVYLVKQTFGTLSDDSNNWLAKGESTFVRAGTARQVVLSKDDTVAWRLSRESEDDALTLEGDIPEGKELDTTRITSIGNVLSSPSFNRVAPASQADDYGLDNPDTTFRVETFDSFLYSIHLGERTEEGDTPITIDVAYTPPPKPAQNEDAEGEDAEAGEGEDADEEASDDAEPEADEPSPEEQAKMQEARDLDARFAEWVYFIPNTTADSMTYSRDALLKDAPAPEEAPEDEEAGTPAPEAETEEAAPAPEAAEEPAEAPAE